MNHAPAFPPNHDPATHEFGLTKREYFVGQVLAGMCANPAVIAHNARSGWSLVNCTPAQLADYCSMLADEALRAAAPQPQEKA